MNDIQFFANLAEIFGGLAVIFGIGFGILKYNRNKSLERREAAATLTRSFQTMEFAAGIRLVAELPENADSAAFRRFSTDDRNLLWFVLSSFESIGILVFRGDLEIELVDDFFSVPIISVWRKLSPYIEDLREEIGDQTWEWVQWLQDKLIQHHQTEGRTPAHIKHAG